MGGQGIVLPRAGWFLNYTTSPPESVPGASRGLLGVPWGCPWGRLLFVWVLLNKINGTWYGNVIDSFVEFGVHLLWSFVSKISNVWGQLPFDGVACWVKSIRLDEK